MKNFIKKIFSVENVCINLKNKKKIYKVICIFGIKFKFKKSELENTKSNNMPYRGLGFNSEITIKNNFIELLKIAAMSLENDVLFSYRHENNRIFIFSKKIFELDSKFIKKFLNYDPHENRFYTLDVLDKESFLYKDNIDSLMNNTYCTKFTNRGYYYVIRQDIYRKNGEIYIKKDAIGYDNLPKNEYFCYNPTDVKYVEGKVLFDYLITLTEIEQKELLKKFYDYIFEKYCIDENTLSGELFDCHLRNFIYDGELFYAIDTEYFYKKGISKSFFIYRSLTTYKSELANLYQYFLDLYNLTYSIEEDKNFSKQIIRKYLYFNRDDSLKHINSDIVKQYFI